MANLKVELCKVSDKHSELLELFINSQSNKSQTPVDNIDFADDYFISNWLISNWNRISYMEDNMKTDCDFQK